MMETKKIFVLILYLGVVHSQWFESEVTGYYKRKGDAPSNNISNSVRTLQECADTCTAYVTCKSFFYNFATSNCYLKSTESYPVVPSLSDYGYIYTKEERLGNCNTTLVRDDPLVTLSASTVNNDNYYYSGPYNAYLDSAQIYDPPDMKYGCWMAGVANQNQWWQVEFPEPRIVQAVVTQGCNQQPTWVVEYKVLFSDDGEQFDVVGESDTRHFPGNDNSDGKVVNFLPETLTKFVRIQPMIGIGSYPSMRIEILGCVQDDAEHIEYLVDTSVMATSSVFESDSFVYGPTRGHLNSALLPPMVIYGAWKAGDLNQEQYIQITFPYVYMVRAVTTQGANGAAEWVTSYDVIRSLDGVSWHMKQQGLIGNTDSDGKVTHFMTPFLAKSIRIAPQTFYGYMSMRVGVFGRTEPSTLIVTPCVECSGNDLTAVTDNDTATCVPIPSFKETHKIFPLELTVSLPYNLSHVSIRIIGVAPYSTGHDQLQVVTVLNNKGVGTLYEKCEYVSGGTEAGLSVGTYTCAYIDGAHTILAGVIFSNNVPGTICEIELS
ncbi:unnamed protein product [Owenia fusiformis]|uniref:Uncharacterized protein n=1 Tax=Owenia fusiformis TaxID=6347 RepID=A0A8S4PHX7_OWEFU|nr:unnamed protein product [Owenia fusiformis]